MWLVAIRPSDSVVRPRDRRSVVGVGLKGALAGCAHKLVDAIDDLEVDLGRLAGLFSGGFRWQRSRRRAS